MRLGGLRAAAPPLFEDRVSERQEVEKVRRWNGLGTGRGRKLQAGPFATGAEGN
jgi:hypothetical protein